jgi:hypothetical protein
MTAEKRGERGTMSARLSKVQLRIKQLKQSVLSRASSPLNRDRLDLSRHLDLLYQRDPAELQSVIRAGALSRRTAYYLLKVGQLIRAAKLSTSQAERIGWTKLQIIGDKLNGKNAARLLKLAEENNAQELKRLVREDSPKQKPHCLLLYFGTDQYRQFRRAVLRHGASSAGRGLVGKEEAIMRIIRLADA